MDEVIIVDQIKDEAIKYEFLEPKKVLVVEDDKNITVLVGKALLELMKDVEINWAPSLEKAVAEIILHNDVSQSKPYDLIIVDVFLEGNGTGFDLIKVIQRIYPTIPFLVISSLSHEFVKECMDEFIEKNIVYLKKPFLYSQCKEEVKNILNNSKLLQREG